MAKGFSLVDMVVGIVFLSVVGVVAFSRFIPLSEEPQISQKGSVGIPCDNQNSSLACSK
ncbi:hypothetical protein L2750_08310 [Shewanella submarina]|uniref:Prepilin-type N-terminal cleavage/methylation domain-containing protein n=1 Tax=Shewanella submarina TaxID=2016376 RepID=A0ABV7GAT0_9GAMM|nr:hypothetical protein [Shewanella submarina]MCL1037155.1 hypothetical protein [Shewanella submarina]